MNKLNRHHYRSRRGAMIILIAIVMIVLLIGAVFGVDVAYMHMVRAELRTATDAAARAGAETLARTQDVDAAVASAQRVASLNKVAGKGLTVPESAITVGGFTAQQNRFVFDETKNPFVAMRINGSREATSPDGSVPLFFARALSRQSFQPTQTATSAANVRDVALVLDVSGSMNSRSGSSTRLEALKAAVGIFIDEIQVSSPHTFLSLSIYSTNALKVTDLTADLELIRSQVNLLRPVGSTAIGLGLQKGIDSLANDPLNRPFAAKTIVLMTDGVHNTGVNPTVTVQNAVSLGQTVHTVTFSSGANQSLMRQVAGSTDGGIHLHADDAADLSEAFRQIARSLSVILID